ncbi:MAG: replication/maintenance protein RepL, partial [Sulfurihydrogenibium sp.]|nr:replication/maintenance protein RepL [Sulfurihydrogenibium sp.]
NTSRTSEQTVKQTIKNDEPDFVKLYLNALTPLYNLEGLQNKVLIEFVKLMGYDNIVDMNSRKWELLASNLKISIQMARNRISKLCKNHNEIVKSLGKGAYFINPEIFGRGTWQDIKQIRAIFSSDKIETIKEFRNGRVETFTTTIREEIPNKKTTKGKKLQEKELVA